MNVWISPCIKTRDFDNRWQDIFRQHNYFALQYFSHAGEDQLMLKRYKLNSKKPNTQSFPVNHRIILRFLENREEYICAVGNCLESIMQLWLDVIVNDTKIDWRRCLDLEDKNDTKHYLLQKLESLAILEKNQNWLVSYTVPNQNVVSREIQESYVEFAKYFNDNIHQKLFAHVEFYAQDYEHANESAWRATVFLTLDKLYLISQVFDGGICSINLSLLRVVGEIHEGRINNNWLMNLRIAHQIDSPHCYLISIISFDRDKLEDFRKVLIYMYLIYQRRLLDKTPDTAYDLPFFHQLFSRQQWILALNNRIYREQFEYQEAQSAGINIVDISQIAIESVNICRKFCQPLDNLLFKSYNQQIVNGTFLETNLHSGIEMDCFIISLDKLIIFDSAENRSVILKDLRYDNGFLTPGCYSALFEFVFENLPSDFKRWLKNQSEKEKSLSLFGFCPEAVDYVIEFKIEKEKTRFNDNQLLCIERWKKICAFCSLYNLDIELQETDGTFELCDCSIVRSSVVRDLIYSHGLPVQLCIYAWLRWSSVSVQQCVLPEFYDECLTIDSELTDEVGKDIDRTMPQHSFFSHEINKKILHRILVAYGIRNQSIGYAQSMNIFTALILMLSNCSEPETFTLVSILCEDILIGYYDKNGMIGLRADVDFIVDIINDRFDQIPRHLSKISQVTTVEVLCYNWLPQILYNVIGAESTIRLLSIMFYERSRLILLKCCISAFHLIVEFLFECNDDENFDVRLQDSFPSLGRLLEYSRSEEMSWLTQSYYEQNIKKHLMYRSFSDRYDEHSLLIKKPPSIVDPLAKRFSKTSLNIVQNVGRRQTINDVLNVYFPPAINIFWKDVQ